MKNAGGDTFVIARQEPSRALVEHHQAWSVRRAYFLVGVVNAGAGVQVKMIAMDEDRTVRGIVRPDASSFREVEKPENVRVQRTGLKRLGRGIAAARREVRAFVVKRSIIPILKTAGIETHRFA